MKFKKLVISLAIMIAITPAISSAASDDECGIWLCAPIGFAPGDCAGPHRAMIRRIHKLQSPLPSLSSCGSNVNTDTVVAHDGRAAYIPSHEICLEYSEETIYTAYGPKINKTCIRYGESGDSWVKDRFCNPNCGNTGCNPDPKGCIRTDYYVEVYNADGTLIGQPYFFNID